MQKHGKGASSEIKNPSVWRKTGQPDTAKGNLAKNVFQSHPDNSIIQGFGERVQSDPKFEKALFQTQGSSLQEQQHMKAGNDGHKKDYHHGPSYDKSSNRNKNAIKDPLGLGFQGKGNKKIDLSRDGQTLEDDMAYKGHLPLIKDSTTVQKNEKYSRQAKNMSGSWNQYDGAEKEMDLTPEDRRRNSYEQEHLDVVEELPELKYSSHITSEETTGAKQETEYTKFPKMKTENIEVQKQTTIDLVSKRKRLAGGGFIEDESSNLRSPLVPFEISDSLPRSNVNPNTTFRKKEAISLPKAEKKEMRRNHKRQTERKKSERKMDVEKGNDWLKDEIKNMRYRRSSIFTGNSAGLSLSEKALHAEIYGMQKLHFTSNFTFSFFDMPSFYQEQNDFLRSSVNRIGMRNARPKFSKPLPKTKPKKIVKTD